MNINAVRELFDELLEKYRAAQQSYIYERSGDIGRDSAALAGRIHQYRERLREALGLNDETMPLPSIQDLVDAALNQAVDNGYLSDVTSVNARSLAEDMIDFDRTFEYWEIEQLEPYTRHWLERQQEGM